VVLAMLLRISREFDLGVLLSPKKEVLLIPSKCV